MLGPRFDKGATLVQAPVDSKSRHERGSFCGCHVWCCWISGDHSTSRRTKGLTKFEFRKIDEEEPVDDALRGMTVYICVSGYIRQPGAQREGSDGGDTLPSTDFFDPWGAHRGKERRRAHKDLLCFRNSVFCAPNSGFTNASSSSTSGERDDAPANESWSFIEL